MLSQQRRRDRIDPSSREPRALQPSLRGTLRDHPGGEQTTMRKRTRGLPSASYGKNWPALLSQEACFARRRLSRLTERRCARSWTSSPRGRWRPQDMHGDDPSMARKIPLRCDARRLSSRTKQPCSVSPCHARVGLLLFSSTAPVTEPGLHPVIPSSRYPVILSSCHPVIPLSRRPVILLSIHFSNPSFVYLDTLGPLHPSIT